ncbi:unnamed protein product, partial [Staurois parvus]
MISGPYVKQWLNKIHLRTEAPNSCAAVWGQYQGCHRVPLLKVPGNQQRNKLGNCRFWKYPLWSSPLNKPHPITSMPPSPWIPLLHLPHTPL